MRRQIWSGIIQWMLFTGVGLAQTYFSADIVDLQKPGTPVIAKLSFTEDKRRLDMQSGTDAGSIVAPLSAAATGKPAMEVWMGAPGRAIILNLTDHTSTLLQPDQKTYHTDITGWLKAGELYELYTIVHPVSVDDACAEWMKLPSAEGERCKRVGEEKVNGRNTVKYDLSCYGEICHLWIDRSLRVIVKRVTIWNSTELRNIQEIPQDYSLFLPPPAYTERLLDGVVEPHQPQ
jgi:hypothetical protein